jgi:hypothetical protein
MGQEIVYCFKCQTRLLGADFEKGRAFKLGPRASCLECAKDLLTPDQIQQELDRSRAAAEKSSSEKTGRFLAPPPQRPAHDKSGRHHAPSHEITLSDSSSKMRPLAARAHAPRSAAPLVATAVAGIFGVLLLLALAFSTGRPVRPHPSPEARAASSDPAPEPPPPPRPDPPRPDPPRPSPAPPRATAPADPSKALSEIDRDVRAFSDRQEFRQAIDYLTAAQARHAAADWVRAVDERIGQVQQQARRAAAAAAELAAAARKKGDEAEVARLRARIAEWRLPTALDDFERAVAPARPPAPVPEGALVVYADGLAPGWSDFSWDVKVDLSCAAPVFEGARSIAATPGKPAGGLCLGIPDRLDTSPYSHLVFMLYARVPDVPLTLALYGEKEPLADPLPLSKIEGGLPAGEWRKIAVPLARLGTARANVKGIVLRANAVSAEPLFYVDHVHFLKRPSEDPAAAAAAREAYRGRWAQAAAKAARRDYPGAVRDLEEAQAGLPDGPVRQESEEDLADLRAAEAALTEAFRILGRLPRGQKLTVEFTGSSGGPERLEGTLAAADAARVSLLTDTGVTDIPAGELSAAWLGELFRRRPGAKPGDERAAALLCLFEGDAEGAGKQKAGAPPEKASALTRPAGEEAARALFWALEAEFASPRARPAAVEKLLALLADPGAGSFVARNRAFLAARMESARETFWAADDLSAVGGFQAWSPPRQDPVWLNLAQARGNAKDNYVELEFYALPDVTYKAWVLAGGCCYETLACSLQATELKGPSPKNPKETVSFEPGSDEGMPVRLPSLSLKRLHSAHAGPRQPGRWDWIPLALPKFSTPGRKKVRVLAEEIGFSAAGAVVSASRAAPPREGDWSEWLKSRPPLEAFATGYLVWEMWAGIPGDALAELTGNPAFERKPSATGGADRFEVGDLGSDYGCRLRGYVVPPATGPYTFWIASDDQSELWLSGDESPHRKVKIAELRGAVGYGEWARDASQKSAPIPLVAGRRYYIEALQKEGGGSAFVQVGWQLPDGAQERPIPGKRLSPFGGMPGRKATRRLYRAINFNGPPLVIDGHAWEGREAPNVVLPGSDFEKQSTPLNPPTDANRAQMIRSSVWARPSSTVRLTAVPPGTYEVFLYLWEDSAAQTIDLFVQGQLVQENCNSGPAGHWQRLGPWRATVADGSLEVSSRGGDANFSGLEVWRLAR